MKVLLFRSSCCFPCKVLQRTIADAGDKVDVEIDVVEETDPVAMKYRIVGYPTMVMVDETRGEIKRVMGSIPEKELLEWIK
jgi:thioredoxin-related protein